MKARIFKTHPDAIIPSRKSDEAAGYDIHCLEDFSIQPGGRVVVRTGLVIQPEEGFHIELLARSGLAYKHGIMLTNNVGLVDRDFAGPKDEIAVMLYRVPVVEYYGSIVQLPFDQPIEFKKGDRIAQLVFRETVFMDLVEVDQAPGDLDRGGLGSTGVK
jgi:dUTP pyrophosphatase